MGSLGRSGGGMVFGGGLFGRLVDDDYFYLLLHSFSRVSH